MFRTFETENNVMKNVAREVVRDSSQRGVTVSVDLAVYMVRLTLLDPSHGFSTEKVMERSLTQKLIDECVNKLCLQQDTTMDVIRFQVYWGCNFTNREFQKRENRKSVNHKALPFLKEIVEAPCHSKDDAEKIYKKMITFTVLYSGLGNPTSMVVMREAHAAMHSVFRLNEIEQCTSSMSRKEKEQQMIELTQIVTGIRLFNRDCQKGGESIDDLPSLLTQAVDATREKINHTLELVMNRINSMTSTLENAYQMETARYSPEDRPVELEFFLPESYKKEDLDVVKKALVMMRQHEICLKKLSVELEIDHEEIAALLEQLQKVLVQLHETVRFRTAIPTVQVYPLFIELSLIWTDLQDETALLSHINTVLVQLTALNKYLEPLPLEEELSLETPISDAERLLQTTGSCIAFGDDVPEDIKLLTPSNVSNFDEINIQLEGFCAWSLVQAEGALIPGNPNIGLLQYNGLNYAFSSPEVALKWCVDPNKFVLKALNLARIRPEFVFLLNLYDQLDAVKSKVLITAEKEVVITKNVEVQTVLHPIESYIDKDYTFSEWELKRRAIQLANIVKCQTKSQQTVNHSHFRAHIGLQVAPDKTRETQTKRDSSCNHPRLSNYIWGLRGRQDCQAHVITLTRPVDEQMRCPDELPPCTRKTTTKKRTSVPSPASGSSRLEQLGSPMGRVSITDSLTVKSYSPVSASFYRGEWGGEESYYKEPEDESRGTSEQGTMT